MAKLKKKSSAARKVAKVKRKFLKTKKPAAKPSRAPKAAKKAAQKATPPPAAAQEPAPKAIKLKLPAAQRKHYEKLLIQIRDHLLDGINFLAKNNLHNSQRESSGDISSYGTHMADAGTDSFDREFALSLVSNEQEALYEVTEALKRLENSTYGVCAMCSKPVNRHRLEALPFASLCVKCQEISEKDHRRPARPATAFPQFEDAEEGEAEGEEEKEKA
jgi:DnaK suppressor protein